MATTEVYKGLTRIVETPSGAGGVILKDNTTAIADSLSTKLGTTGGTITGDLTIENGLDVNGGFFFLPQRQRGNAAVAGTGAMCWDTDLGLPVYSDGGDWYYFDNTAV